MGDENNIWMHHKRAQEAKIDTPQKRIGFFASGVATATFLMPGIVLEPSLEKFACAFVANAIFATIVAKQKPVRWTTLGGIAAGMAGAWVVVGMVPSASYEEPAPHVTTSYELSLPSDEKMAALLPGAMATVGPSSTAGLTMGQSMASLLPYPETPAVGLRLPGTPCPYRELVC